MGNRYIVTRDNFTPSGGSDAITIVSPANRRIRLIEVSVAGRGTSSAAQQFQIGTSTAGTTPSTPITPSAFSQSEQPSAASSVYTAWAVQPTVASNFEVIGYNALGGANRWIPPGGVAFEVRNGACISLRATSGPTWQNASVSVVYEED